MTRTTIAAIVGTLGICVSGCAGDVGSAEDARAGWVKTEAQLSSGSNGAQSAGAPAGDVPVFRADPLSINVDFDYSCASGGSINYKGSYKVSTAPGATGVDFDYAATFKGCDAGGVTIDGDVDYSAVVATSDAGSSVDYSYRGDLTWKGDVEGACVVEMDASVSTSAAGVSVSYKGSICGYDAAASLNVGA